MEILKTKLNYTSVAPVLILLILAIVFYLGLFKINEYDVFHHLAAGKYIIENKKIPHQLIFSHSFGNLKANDNEWLFQIILWSIYKVIGINGLIILKAIFFVFLYWLLILIALEDKANLYIITIVFLWGSLVARLRFYHRPEMMMSLWIALTILLIRKYLSKASKKVYFLPLIFIMWANTHPTVIIGFFIILAFIAQYFISWFISIIKKNKINSAIFFNLIYVLIIAFIFSLINPFFISPIVEPLKLSKTRILMGLVSELQPLRIEGINSIIGNDISFILFLFFLVGFISFILNFKKAYLAYFIIFLGFAYMATQAIRNVSIFIQVASPIICINISEILKGARVKLVRVKLVGIALVLITFIYILFAAYKNNEDYQLGLGINEFLIPTKAVDFIIKNKISGRMFNTFHFGGYLEYKLYPQEKVLIDGRGFGNEHLLQEYVMSQSNEKLWRNYQEKYNLDYAIVGYPDLKNIPKVIHDYMIVNKNEKLKSLSIPDENWALIYFDDTAMIYLKKIKKFENLIKKYEIKLYKPDLPLDMLKAYLKQESLSNELINEIKKNESSYRANLALGFIYNDIGNYNKAIESYRKVISIRSSNDAAYAGLGYAYLKLGNINEAEFCYKKAIKLNKNDAFHYYNLGIIYLEKRNIEKAIYHLEKALELNEDFTEAYKKLINLYLAIGDFKKYNKIYHKLKIMEKTDLLREKFNKALKLYSEGKLTEALKEYIEILQYDKNNPVLLNNIGFIFYDLKNYSKAAEYHNRCIEINPDFENGHYGLALAYEKLGKKDAAIKEWEIYLKLKPKGIWALKAEEHLKRLINSK